MNKKAASEIFTNGLSSYGQRWAAERAIAEFVRRVNAQAEKNMLKTGKLEGAHHAAMKQVLKEWEINT